MSINQLIAEAVQKAVREALKDVRPASSTPDELLSVSRAAELADVSDATIKRWVKEGRLKRYGSGRAVRVRRDDVLNLQPAAAAGEVDLDALTKKLLGD